MSTKLTILLAIIWAAIPIEPINGYYILSCVCAPIFMFAVTYFQDARKLNRPTWMLRASCVTAATYLGYFLYPEVRDIAIYNKHVFSTMQVWLMVCSYFSVSFFRNLKFVQVFGWRALLVNVGNYLTKLKK